MSTEFETVTEDQALKAAIVARIEREGAISFRDFMGMALYDPQHGYYQSRREKIGREGDYVTSPSVSPIFGALVARQLREMWEAMGSPSRFDVVEAGPGTGHLCRDILRWAGKQAPDFARAIAYTLVEVGEALLERQRETLAGYQSKVRWAGDLPAEIEGCILSNELLDSFPVHRVTSHDGGVAEVFVRWDEGCFTEELRPASADVLAYFQGLGLQPGEACTAEVNLAAVEWVRRAARVLSRGFVLTFDYGYEAADLYASWRTDGTLLCFYRHNASADPYSRIGRQDMTSHVDFTTVRAAGHEEGLESLGFVSQTEFLTNLGMAEAAAPPADGDTNLEEYYARRRAVSELIDPAALGRIRVLLQAKGLGRPILSGVADRSNG